MKKLWILLFIPFLLAAAPTKTTTFSSNTTIRASEVNTNFDDLYGYLQTGVDTLRAAALDAITEIAAALRSGSDQTLITGTEGSNTELAVWNSDGDLISLTIVTGNTTGVGISTNIKISSYTSCTTLSTDASGNLVCNP